MCIDYKMTKKERNSWLKNKDDVIVAYKAVKVYAVHSKEKSWERFYPLFLRNTKGAYFKRNNIVRIVTDKKHRKCESTYFGTNLRSTTYVAYFHLFTYEDAAEDWADWTGGKVIECRIPKKYITDVGKQEGREVIVTRQFSIVGQDHYLD